MEFLEKVKKQAEILKVIAEAQAVIGNTPRLSEKVREEFDKYSLSLFELLNKELVR